MARRALKKTDEKPAPKVVKRSLYILKQALIVVGRPAFFLLSRILIAILFIFYITGYGARLLAEEIFGTFASMIQSIITFYQKVRLSTPELKRLKTPQISFKIKIPKALLPKIYLPKVKIPRISLRLPKFHFKYLIILGLFIVFCAIPFSFINKVFENLPSPHDLTQRNIEVSTKIYDRDGVLLYKIYKNKNRTIIPLEEIPMQVRYATLAAEDAEFYSHPGFSVKGIIRAIYKNITKGELSGGSTITQQLVKNAFLTPEKTWLRKAKEIVLAIQVEMAYSKDQILEMYLNEVSYGGTAYGIQEASNQYFGKNVEQLSIAEAALLAGLPKSPTKYSPFGNPALSSARQKEVLNLMRINKFITEDAEKAAESETLRFADQKIDIKAPHFVMYVRQILEETYGKETVSTGGLNVITTLDYDIQQLAEEVVKSEIDKLKNLNVTNAAVLVLNPSSGEVLAMVGSYDYFDTTHDGNVNVVTSNRQPGSSIKIVNYAYALSHGYTPATILEDTPVTFLVEGQPPYTPKDYDGTYRGSLTLRSAFAESRNIPAVRVLASYGVKNMIEQGKSMGITTWDDEERFGLSLTLGGGEVKLIDLARAYATVANYGTRPEISSIEKVSNYQDKSIFVNPCTNSMISTNRLENNFIPTAKAAEADNETCRQEEVLDPRVAFLLTDILRDNAARAPAFGNFSQLVIPNHQEVAVKTGTSNNLRDNLTIGYNQKYLVAVWVGNNDNSPMSRVASGVTGASPIFNKIMSTLLSNESNHDWTIPTGLVQKYVCLTPNGKGKNEWFLDENVPNTGCNTNTSQPLGKEKEITDGTKTNI